MENNILKEACVETLAQALNAVRLGADRIELCACLELGGTTPPRELIQAVCSQVDVPVKVMIRPRGGNFVYNTQEMETIRQSIIDCQSLGVQEIVTGILALDNEIDIHGLQKIAKWAAPLSICFHKAIDEVSDVKLAIQQLKEIPNVISILSSGQHATAWDGKEVLREMLKTCGTHLQLIVAGKVSKDNLLQIHQSINAQEYHGRKIVGDLD